MDVLSHFWDDIFRGLPDLLVAVIVLVVAVVVALLVQFLVKKLLIYPQLQMLVLHL